MHVTIVGAGVLGRIYGVRLLAEGEDVSFVVRPDRASDTAPFVIEQVNGGGRRDAVEAPIRVTEIPRDTDIVMVTLRHHELSARSAGGDARSTSLPDLLRSSDASRAPVAILTPMMPAQQKALEQMAPGRIVPAMPGVVGYLDDRGVVRYWVPTATSTVLGESSAPVYPGDDGPPPIEALARKLTQIDLPTRIDRNVGALNVASTTSFFPLIASIDVGGGIRGVLEDRELLATTLDAVGETGALSRKLGASAAWTYLLMRFVGPLTLGPAVALGRLLFPESVMFVDRHFGSKLHEQHIAMGEAILALGSEHGIDMPSLNKLMDRLRSSPAPEKAA